jgi:DNA-directed RNA polymerase
MNDQLALEKSQIEEGKLRYHRRTNNLSKMGQTSETYWGKNLLKQALPNYITGLSQWFQSNEKFRAGNIAYFHEVRKVLSVEEIAETAIQEIINSLTTGEGLNRVCLLVGHAIEFRYVMKQASESISNREWNDIIRNFVNTHHSLSHKQDSLRDIFTAKGFGFSFDTKQRLVIGNCLVQLFKSSTGLIEFILLRSPNFRMKTHVVLAEEAKQWVEKMDEHCEIMNPVRYPMVASPDEWQPFQLYSGGYKLPQNKLPLIKSHHRLHHSVPRNNPMRTAIEAVNGLQKVPWKVNTQVLEVVDKYFSEKRSINDILPFHGLLDLPPKPHDMETNENARKYWRRQANNVYRSNYENKTRFFLIAKTIHIARLLKGHEKLWFPMQLDFRGRMYYSTECLHPQGSDLARSLLTFGEAKPLKTEEDFNWFLINGANKFGMDKESFEVRLQWVDENFESIRRSAEDPYSETWWTSADKPWQFLAWCFEYWRFHTRTTEEFETNLPCGIDSTNNGLQILSLLSRDKTVAVLTNVLNPSKKAGPNDIYRTVLNRVISRLQETNDDLSKKLLQSGLVRRSVIKVPVMAMPYGIKPQGTLEAIDSEFKRISFNEPKTYDILPDSLRRSAALLLGNVIREVMGDLLHGPKQVMEWLKETTKKVSSQNVFVQWLTPSGFRVVCAYPKTEIQSFNFSVERKMVNRSFMTEDDSKVSSRTTINSICANFVHSLDASVAHIVAQKASQLGISLGVIHDCYATHPSDVQVIISLVRDTYADMFSSNLLEDFRQQLSCQVVKNKPEKIFSIDEDFPIDQVRQSEYFLC